MWTILSFHCKYRMCVAMCESPESVTLLIFWGVFVIMNIILAMAVLVFIGIPFIFPRGGLPKIKNLYIRKSAYFLINPMLIYAFKGFRIIIFCL